MLHFLHLIAAALLLAVVLADFVLLRSAAGEALEPREQILSWRKRAGLAEMLLFLIVFILGLSMWLPLVQAYPPHIFHTKLALALLFLVLAKVRMLRERKKGVQMGLTRAMAVTLGILFCLGAYGGLGL